MEESLRYDRRVFEGFTKDDRYFASAVGSKGFTIHVR